MSICEIVSCEARRTFWPRRPIARLNWSSGTTTSIRLSSSSMTTRLTVAGCSALTTQVAADDAFGAAKIDDDVAELDALDHAGDDLVRAILELLELALALGVADFLENDLLGGLCRDSAEFDRRQGIDDEVADGRALLK